MFGVLLRGPGRQALSRRCLATKVPPPPPKPSPSSKPKLPQAPANPKTTQGNTPDPAPAPAPLLNTPSSISLDFSPAEQEAERERTGAKSSKDSLSSIERRRRVFGRVSLAALALGFGVQLVYMGREWDEEELKAKKLTLANAPSTWSTRASARITDLFDFFNKPQWTELLPPPLPAPHQKPYTLLVSIDDLIVTSTWDRQYGWRTAKRPGVDYFLGYISQFYEVVIFTTQHHYTALPIIEKLDPYNFYINYKLFREATRSVDGKVVKDLSYLNRDLSKVILLDTHEEHVSTHPENSIVIPKWTGDPQDRGLIAMIPFLESVGIYKPPDVRPILQAYHGKDIPLEYAKKEAEAKAKHIEEWRNGKGLVSSGFTLSSLFGNAGSTGSSPPTYLEQKRKEAQQIYKDEQAYIQEHKGEFERLLEEDRLAAAREMSGSLWGALDALAGGGPAKKPDAAQSGSATPSPADSETKPAAAS